MAPASRYGDIARIDPMLPQTVDTEVVIYKGDEANGDAVIGTLIAYDEKEWTVELLKPETKLNFKRSEWQLCHRIVGENARR